MMSVSILATYRQPSVIIAIQLFLHRTSLHKFKFKLYCDRRSVGQFVLVSGPFWGPWPDFNFLCLTVALFLLHVGRPLWWENGSVIYSAITHWLESRRTHNHILLSHLRFPNQEDQVPVFISPRTGWPSYTPGHWVPFSSSLTTCRATAEVF
jgi:hypothetical protein